jgi:cellobiose phosphorylase
MALAKSKPAEYRLILHCKRPGSGEEPVMRYGHFDDDAREYIVDRPDTPKSWINYAGSRIYGAIVTNNAGGYSFYRSPAEGRILRFRFNSIPADQPGRYFYLRDRDSGDVWSASWQPVGKPLDQYKSVCRFGMGYTVIASRYASIETESTYFVPLDQTFEYWWLKVRNRGRKPRRLSVFSYGEMAAEWNIFNDTLNLQYVAYIAQAQGRDGMIEVSSCARLKEDPEHFSNRDQSRWWWMAQTGGRIIAHDCDRERFIGRYRSYHNPEAVERGQLSNSVAFSDDPCGAIQSDVELQPGESADVIVLLGIGRADVGARVRAEYGTPARAQHELGVVKQNLHGVLEGFKTETPDEEFNHMVNVWNAYNALMTFAWSRACSLVYTGEGRDAFGYRDTVQDMVGVTGLIPDGVRERLELMITGQDSSGGAQPQVRPWLHKPGTMQPTPPQEYRSDDALWLFDAVPVYVAETGDVDFYGKVLPYADRGEATVLGHLRRALEFNLERTGAHGLPCGLLADWNDCLKLGFHGESLFVAFQLRHGLRMYAGISDHLGQAGEMEWAHSKLKEFDLKLQAHGWDGAWFLRAWREDGAPLGSAKCEEGRIFLNTQSWAVLSGAATAEQATKAMDAVEQHLETEYGLMLLAPPYQKADHRVTRAVLMNPGNKENGGIFSHTQGWAVMADCLMGRGDRAYRHYRAYMPAAQNDKAEIREIEPFVHCQSTHSRFSKRFGASRIPWLSGTASWSYFAATHYILGIRPEVGGLRIDPCVPGAWKEFSVTRRFRGKLLKIRVMNPDGVQKGVRQIVLNGKAIEGTLLAADRLKDRNTVAVTMGSL